MADLLLADDVSKAYGDLWAVRDLTAGFPEGRLTSIIGPNGAGKTTFVNVLTGVTRVNGGRVVLDGEDITRLPVHRRVERGVSRSFQLTSIFPELTVIENVLVPVLARRGEAGHLFRRSPRSGETWAEATQLLAEVGLGDVGDTPAEALAHGDRRLLEIAMALAPRPRLCFLDEPTTGMNPGERGQILELIRELHDAGRTTFVVIEHDMDVVFALSEWILVMHRGEKLAEGAPEEVRDDERVREVYLGEEVGG